MRDSAIKDKVLPSETRLDAPRVDCRAGRAARAGRAVLPSSPGALGPRPLGRGPASRASPRGRGNAPAGSVRP
eukprot:5955838-Alexandrium_andersonii.AAC.1